MVDEGAARPLKLIVGASYFDLTENVGERETFLRLKSLMDGRHSLDAIATRVGLDLSDVVNIVDRFDDLGLLRKERPTALISASDFKIRLDDTLTMWRNQIGYHRLFQSLAAGEVRREVLQGTFLEAYHLVLAAPRHIATAVAAADSDHCRRLLAGYFAEEHDHSAYLLNTCVELGVPADAVRASHPIVGTESLIQMLCAIGRADTLAYIAALALFEAAPTDGAEGQRSALQISQSYGLDALVFGSALEHLQIDVDAKHSSLLHEALEEYEFIPADRVHGIVNLLHDLKHAYDQMHDGILLYYGDISNYVPRPKVDYFAL